MKRFVCTLNDGSCINVVADKMNLTNENLLCAYRDCKLVAVVDISAVISAHLSEKGEGK
jgi:hypothetical protein